MTWTVDRGLDRLLAQINAAAPGRSKASDGSKGDAAHAARVSDHNPETDPPPGNPDNQVDARDFTHDPASGADMAVVTESLRLSRDRRVKYVIFKGRIFSSYDVRGRRAWEWGVYSGTNRHDKHAHVSVNDEHHDETQDWKIGIDMADSPGEVAAQYRLLSLLMLDARLASNRNVHEDGRLPKVPVIDLLLGLQDSMAEVERKLATLDEPTQVVLTDGQLAAVVTAVTDRVAERVIARLSTLEFKAQE